MSIDWITVAAQIANFLILVWLLKRFLYRPILDGIDAREAEIAARVSAAEIARINAEAVEAEYEQKLAGFNNEKMAFLELARGEAENERDTLQSETSDFLQAERTNWQKQKADLRSKYTTDLHAAGAGAILSLSRKALLDLSDLDLEKHIVDHFGNQLSAVSDDLRAASGSAQKAIVVTSFELAKPCRTQFAKRFRDVFSDASVTFETDSTQSPGITLRLGGARIGWTIDTYMEGLENSLVERLEEQSGKREGTG